MKDVNFKSEIVVQNRLKTQEKGAQKGAGTKGSWCTTFCGCIYILNKHGKVYEEAYIYAHQTWKKHS